MTVMDRMIELLPCPFCGSAPVTERIGFSIRAMYIYIYCVNDNGCPRPKAVGETVENAVENWNLRATPTATGGDALRKAAERVCWFDWSDNDMDAVAAIDALRKALTPVGWGGHLPGKIEP